MKSIADELAKFKKTLPNQQENLQNVLETVKSDRDIQQFWQENADQLAADAFDISLSALYQYVLAKEEAGDYAPVLQLERGYVVLAYQPSENLLLQRQQKQNLQSFHMPKAIMTANLRQYDVDSGRQLALAKATQFVTGYLESPNTFHRALYLVGDYGVGKTYLLGAIANELVKKQITVALVHFPSLAVDILSAIGDPKRNVQEELNKWKKVPVLFLDDLGAEALSAYVRDDVLGVILDYRMQNELPTFFSSNLPMKQLEEEHLSHTKNGVETVKAKRLMQRILFLAEEVTVSGKNRRLER